VISEALHDGGGALSAATVLWETHNLRNTLLKMKAGNPCAKAETLRRIRDEIKQMPTTASIAAECERALDLLNLRQTVLTVEEVAKLLEETDEALKQDQDPSSSSSSSSASISATQISASTNENQPKPSRRISLSERLWSRKSRDSTVSNQSSTTSMGYDEDDVNMDEKEVDSQNAAQSDEPCAVDSHPETQCAGETTSENKFAIFDGMIECQQLLS
jgi:hypothetical protein